MSTKARRLAAAVRHRREELDLTQLDLWLAGGPSNSTLTTIENGRLETLTRTTARKLDACLRWETGSARRVWDKGEEPTPLLPGTTPADSKILREQIESADLAPATKAELLRVLDAG